MTRVSFVTGTGLQNAPYILGHVDNCASPSKCLLTVPPNTPSGDIRQTAGA